MTMISQRVGPEGGLGQSSMPANGLQAVREASSTIVGLLPGVMRSMADKIEKASSADTTNGTGILLGRGSADPEAIASQIANELSLELGRHLALRHDNGAQAPRPVHTQVRPLGAVSTNQLCGPRLGLKLLGTPEITLDGVRQKLLERCTTASLIIYLLALHRRGLSTERLAAYIVSDPADIDPFDTGATMRLSTIRTFIWRLRKQARWRDIVVCPGEQGSHQSLYTLPDSTRCDLWEFEDKLDEAARFVVRASIEPGAADRAAAERQDAILLYRGEFCKGIGTGFMVGAAGYLRHRYLQAVMTQAVYWKDKAIKLQEACRGSGVGEEPSAEEENAWLEALNNYVLAAHVEPYDEAAYLGAMLCQAQLGRGSGVKKTLDRYSQLLNT